MARARFWIILVWLVAACTSSPETPDQPATPTLPALEGRVTIMTPLSGSTIYSESLFVMGNAEGISAEGFRLQIRTDEAVLAEATVSPDSEQWSVELVHGYSGDPATVSLLALAADERVPGQYDIETINIAPIEFRPEGVYGSIVMPQPDDTIGGDQIPVMGVASGVFENTFTLVMQKPDGTEINSTIVTMMNPNFVDEVMWQAELITNDYTGPAVIRAFATDARDGSEIDLGSVAIMLSQVAG